LYNTYEQKSRKGDVFILTQEEIVITLLNKNSGYLTAKTARQNGVSNVVLQRMAKRGLIERAAHGLYIGADNFPDPYFITQYRCPKGIFSHETALFLHDLSDRVPLQLMMTIPSGWNSKLLLRDDLMFFYSSPKNMQLGAGKTVTPFGLEVVAYDAGRTICDCLRCVDKLDKDLVLTALKRYIKDPGNDKAKLLEYAAALKIRDLLIKYMEVLL